MAIDLKKLNDEDLIKLYPRLINELKNRKIIRTNNIVWGLISIAHENYDKGDYEKAENFIEKCLSLHKELGEGVHASLTTAHLYLCYKYLGKEYDKNELNNYIKKFGIKDIHYRDNFILYKLLDNESCLKAAYNQIQDKLNVMEDELREKFLNYPIPKQIIEEYNKVMN